MPDLIEVRNVTQVVACLVIALGVVAVLVLANEWRRVRTRKAAQR